MTVYLLTIELRIDDVSEFGGFPPEGTALVGSVKESKIKITSNKN